MSHLLNLFQKPASRKKDRMPVVVPADSEDIRFDRLQEIPAVEANLRPESRIICHTDPVGSGADRFRFLRMRLRERREAGKLKVLLVTSPLAHDGKSTISSNLATALAERGKRNVLVIEADLHHASLSEQLGLGTWPGLTECLNGSLDPLLALRRVEPLGWYLLPAGAFTNNPTELLQTAAFSSVIQQLSPDFEWIIVDTPPVLPITDALSLRQHADGSLLVVRAGCTPDASVEEAVALIGREHMVGIVLNGVEGLDALYSRYDAHPRESNGNKKSGPRQEE
jgi:capsular exopolysaccharide synthesis family protein